jgi:hypothetical protein
MTSIGGVRQKLLRPALILVLLGPSPTMTRIESGVPIHLNWPEGSCWAMSVAPTVSLIALVPAVGASLTQPRGRRPVSEYWLTGYQEPVFWTRCDTS